jgi:hypothetical protein
MKRLLRIFALLTAASMLIWIAGCGDDDDDDDDAGPVPKVVSVSIAEGGSVGGTQPIQVTFSKKVDDGNITIAVSGATGSVAWDAAGKVATWTPSPAMSEGAHTLTVSGTDAGDQELENPTTINFTATVPDTEAPTLDGGNCDPADGSKGVDPGDYGEAIVVAAKDNVGVTEMKVISTDPEFNFTPDFADGKLTLSFMKYSMPNETEFTIKVEAKDGSGNSAELDYSFTTMAKE